MLSSPLQQLNWGVLSREPIAHPSSQQLTKLKTEASTKGAPSVNKTVALVLFSLSDFQQMWNLHRKRRASCRSCNSLKNLKDDEKALTVAMVFGKCELSAKKVDVWTVKEFKSDVKARSEKTTSRKRMRPARGLKKVLESNGIA